MNQNISSNFHRGQFRFSMIMTILILGACTNQSAKITIAEPLTEKVSIEKYNLKNCDSPLTDIHEPMTTNFKLKQEVVVADKAISMASGSTYQLSAVEKEALAGQVANAYQQIYTTAQTELEKQEFVVPMDRAAIYDISWNAQVYQSTLVYDIQGEAYTVEYQYTLTIPDVSDKLISLCGG